ncbi:Zinc finger CCCH domain-containing protein [Drosera capensis]
MEAGVFPSGPYPEREGEPDCSYYVRTGLCRFGSTCRFNHPPNRKLATATAIMKREYPERPGQPECQACIYPPLLYMNGNAAGPCVCLSILLLPHYYFLLQYYLKTDTCKFGATCKFHHPKDMGGIAGRVPLNILGYPLRPNETECVYYLRTGQCKFGSTCKFHHPQPSNMTSVVHGSGVYPQNTPGRQSYPGTNWSLSRASIIPSQRWQGPSTYTSVILSQGVVPVPGWDPYIGQIGSVPSSNSQQQTAGNSSMYGTSRLTELTESQGTYPAYHSGSVPAGYYALQRDNAFPERPGQPECQYYMKTGDCKFGAVCRFHHPKERLIPAPDCLLSPLGLPLRPVRIILSHLAIIISAIAGNLVLMAGKGEPLCIFYSRYGICKFGPNCKFDHPMGVIAYNLSPAASDASNVHRYLGSSSASGGLTLSSEELVDTSSRLTRRLSRPKTTDIASADDTAETEG